MAGKRKQQTGFVLSRKAKLSVIVRVEWLERHPFYGKVMRRMKQFMVHDANDEARTGDKVLVEETRPLTKLKRWKLVKILQRAPVLGELPPELTAVPGKVKP